MAENNFGKGIKITSGFDLGAKSPLDNRSIVLTIAERDAHVTNNRAYEGMKVYVLNEKKEYTYTGTNWEESGGISDEQLEQLIIAYQHSQSKHVTIEDLHTHDNKSVLDGITSDLEKIESSEIEPADKMVSLWINTSEETPVNVITRINDDTVASNTTWSSEKINTSIISSSSNIDLSAYALKTDIPDYEIVTPQMYGAVADGVVDDTISVQNALNSGKSVYFPAGRYKVTSLLQVTNACKISMYKPYPCAYKGDYPLSENDNHMGARIETYSTNGGIIVGDGVEIDGFYMRAMDTFTGILFKFDGTMGQSTYPSRLRLAHIILDNNSIHTVPEVMFDFVPNETYNHILEDITIGSLRGRQFCEYGFRSIMTTSDANWVNSVRIKNLCIDLLADYPLYVEGGPSGCANWVFDCPSIQTYPYVEGDSGYIGKTGHIDIVTFKNMQDVLITGGIIWDLHAASYNRIFNIENSPKIATYCANTFDQIDTYLSEKLQVAADNLNIENMDITLVGDAATGGNYLTLSDGANNKSVLIPGAVLDDEQVNAGISNWFSENAAPIEQIGRNKYNPNDPLTQLGYYYTGNVNTGMFADEGNGMHTSNLIEAKEGDVIRISKNNIEMGAYNLHMLDENQKWLSSISWTADADKRTVDNPDTKYIRITWSKGYFTYEDRATSNICVTVNDTNTSYTPYAINLVGGIGSYLVLQSPNGTQFTLETSDEGVISGKCVNGDVEPPTYVTETELNAKGYLTEHQDISGLATKEYVDNAITNLNIDIDYDSLLAFDTKEIITNSNYVDSDKNIILDDDLPAGTYTLKYEFEDGTYADIKSFIISNENVDNETIEIDLMKESEIYLNQRYSKSNNGLIAQAGVFQLIIPFTNINNDTMVLSFSNLKYTLLAGNSTLYILDNNRTNALSVNGGTDFRQMTSGVEVSNDGLSGTVTFIPPINEGYLSISVRINDTNTEITASDFENYVITLTTAKEGGDN